MGIPSYFKYLIKKYPRDELLVETPPDNCKALYLDLNGIIHTSSQFIVKQYENNIISGMTSLQTPESVEIEIQKNRVNILEELHPKMFKHVFESIQKLATFVSPTELLYIAMDGVAPRAKMQQQRQRRFKKAMDQEVIHNIYRKHNTPYIGGILFDSNCITPGTTFMYKLSEYLRPLLNTLKEKCPSIIFSDTSVPGEGEHKIIQHIKTTYPLQSDKEKGWHVIHGLDADLIMLSMTCKNVNMLLLREQMQNNVIQRDDNGDALLAYFNIEEFKKLIISHMENIGGVYYEENIRENIINDYIVLCFLLGNDFLPHPLSLSIHERGVDTLLGIYAPMQKKLNTYLIQSEKKVTVLNNDFLKAIMYRLSQREENAIIKSQKKNKKHFFSMSETDNELYNDLKKQEIIPKKMHYINDEKIKVGVPGWETRYYLTVDNISDERDVSNMCKNYCNGLFWNIQYYFHSCYSTEWYYRYLGSPVFEDVYNYLENNDINKQLLPSQKKYISLEQLLIVLPEKSHNDCLPRLSSKYINNMNGNIYYPLSTELNTVGHQSKWQCPLYLPTINEVLIKKITEKILLNASLSEKDVLDFGKTFYI